MSSLRNAVARPTHRERAQPQARQKWGLLEKHKDYSLRAADYNTKKRKLNELSRKARERNPDEFAFGMVNKAQGKHGRGGEENRLGHDAVKLLKTQDAGYLRVVTAKNRRELEETQQLVNGDRVAKTGTVKGKVVFDEDGEAIKRGRERDSGGVVLEEVVDQIDVAAVTSTEEGDDTEVRVSKQKSKKEIEAENKKQINLKLEKRKRKRMQELRAAKLEVLKKRQKEILAAADELELQRAKMAKTVGGTNKDGVKWKIRERKK